MGLRAAAAGFGVAFGFLIAWSQVPDPDVIRRMLLLQDAYVYVVMGTSIAVALVGLRLLRALRVRALVTGDLVSWVTTRPARKHLVGSGLFGVGWAVTSSCPGPIAAQLGQGMLWSLFTIAGIAVGILAQGRVRARVRRPAPAAALGKS
jgi:uncharacterized membrane protein YedE/YeeE